MGWETWVALGLAGLGAAVVAGSGQGTRAGALAGLAVAVASILGLGAGTLLPLAVFVLGAGALTRLGRSKKEALGAAERNEGTRDPRHVAAKLGLPALLGLAGIAGGPAEPLSVAYAAAIAGAFADTAATEVGPVLGGAVFGWRGLRVVPLRHGDAGGMSAGGLAASAGASAAVAVSALGTGLVHDPRGALAVAGAGIAASFVESAVGGTGVGKALGHFGRNVLVSVLAAAAGALSSGAWAAN